MCEARFDLLESLQFPAAEKEAEWRFHVKAAWMNLIKQSPAAKATIDLKLRAVFSHRRATHLKRLILPTPCSMRALAL